MQSSFSIPKISNFQYCLIPQRTINKHCKQRHYRIRASLSYATATNVDVNIGVVWIQHAFRQHFNKTSSTLRYTYITHVCVHINIHKEKLGKSV